MKKIVHISNSARVGPVRRILGRAAARILGWKISCELPESLQKAVVIASPHTSNWDAILLVVTTWAMGIQLSFVVKHTAWRWPFRRLLQWLGGVPIDRRTRAGIVGQIADQLTAADAMLLAIAPAGTRSCTDRWRSGFYRIAEQAQVPLVCGYLDFGRKEAGMGPIIEPTDLATDMDRIRAFYDGIEGRHPDRHSRIWLEAEEG